MPPGQKKKKKKKIKTKHKTETLLWTFKKQV